MEADGVLVRDSSAPGADLVIHASCPYDWGGDHQAWNYTCSYWRDPRQPGLQIVLVRSTTLPVVTLAFWRTRSDGYQPASADEQAIVDSVIRVAHARGHAFVFFDSPQLDTPVRDAAIEPDYFNARVSTVRSYLFSSDYE